MSIHAIGAISARGALTDERTFSNAINTTADAAAELLRAAIADLRVELVDALRSGRRAEADTLRDELSAQQAALDLLEEPELVAAAASYELPSAGSIALGGFSAASIALA